MNNAPTEQALTREAPPLSITFLTQAGTTNSFAVVHDTAVDSGATYGADTMGYVLSQILAQCRELGPLGVYSTPSGRRDYVGPNFDSLKPTRRLTPHGTCHGGPRSLLDREIEVSTDCQVGNRDEVSSEDLQQSFFGGSWRLDQADEGPYSLYLTIVVAPEIDENGYASQEALEQYEELKTARGRTAFELADGKSILVAALLQDGRCIEGADTVLNHPASYYESLAAAPSMVMHGHLISTHVSTGGDGIERTEQVSIPCQARASIRCA